MSNIVILGGTGILGRELKSIDNSLHCVGSEIDIFDYNTLSEYLIQTKADIIVNCVAIKSEKVTEDRVKSIDVNIIGHSNVCKFCIKNKKKLFFISTDYVYPGDKGNFKETDYLYPHNPYAWTKLAGESATFLVPDSCIIRTSFGENIFSHKLAYNNLYTSKDYVDIVAPIILKVIKSETVGIINIGTERKSVFVCCGITTLTW